MSNWFRREWTPQDADEWTKEDGWAILFSCLAYMLLTIGVGLSLLVPFWGLPCVALGVACALIMYWIIDPKLRTLSDEYESKQKEYLEALDRTMKWEEE